MADTEEAKKASLKKQLENLSHLRSPPLAGAKKALALEVAAQCLEVGIAAKSKGQFGESAHWLQEAWSLSSGIAEVSAAGLALGEVLGLCCGKYAEAEEIMRQCYDFAAHFNPLSEEALMASIWTAGLFYHSGKWRKVEEECERVLCTFDSSAYPAEHFWTTLLYLTCSCWYQENGTKAHGLVEEWSRKQLSGENALSEALKLTVLARNAWEKSNYVEAGEMLASALSKHQVTASVLAAFIHRHLGLPSYRLKQWNETEQHFQRAKEIYRAVSPLSIDAAINLNNLGLLYHALKRWDEAEEYYKYAKDIYGVVSPTNILAAKNLNNMGVLFENLKRWVEAEEHYKHAREIYSAVSPQSADAALNFSNIGNLCYGLAQWNEAVEYYKRAHMINCIISPKSIETANCLFDIGAVYEAISKPDKALNAVIKAHRIYSVNQSDSDVKKSLARIRTSHFNFE